MWLCPDEWGQECQWGVALLVPATPFLLHDFMEEAFPASVFLLAFPSASELFYSDNSSGI